MAGRRICAGPVNGRVLRLRLPDLVRQEIWAYLIVHYAISVLIARAWRGRQHPLRRASHHPDPPRHSPRSMIKLGYVAFGLER
jgi:hypothetical protein